MLYQKSYRNWNIGMIIFQDQETNKKVPNILGYFCFVEEHTYTAISTWESPKLPISEVDSE